MRYLSCFLAGARLLLSACGGLVQRPGKPASLPAEATFTKPTRTVERIDTFAEAVRLKNSLPTVFVAAFDFQGISAQGVADLRRTGGTSITVNDRFHIGSCTKAMTATLVARLVEAEQLQWSDTLQVLFSRHQIHPQFWNVTVEQLLRQGEVTSSLPGHAQAI